MKFSPISLRETVRRGLYGIAQLHAELVPVAQQGLKARRVLRRGDDEDVPDMREHERGQGVIDHGLVVDREQLFGCNHGEGVQPRARPAG